MAPDCPEEVDVFTVPHSRMKELVHKYIDMMMNTNFSDVRNLTNMLENLYNTFKEFKTHEQIENKYIMKRLKDKLKKLSIKNTAVCNCHSDNRLTEMLLLVKDGYKLTRKSEADRMNYGTQLRKELEEFTEKFIPHMEEEESVFQPLLMKYFTFEELKQLKNTVIQQHVQQIQQKTQDTERKIILDEVTSESDDEVEKYKKEKQRTNLDKIPDEVMLNVFQYLNPKELITCAQVSHHWNNLALDGSLWKTFCPVQWSKGEWTFRPNIDVDKEEKEHDITKKLTEDVTVDDDADFDETDDSESSDDSLNVKQIRHEAKMLSSIVKNLLPRIKTSVKSCNLAYSKGLTNGMNLEELDLTQTNISDIGFKGFGKNGCGKKLKSINLSGCVNVTDVTLQRLCSAMDYLPYNAEVTVVTEENDDEKIEKNEIESSEKMLGKNHKSEKIVMQCKNVLYAEKNQVTRNSYDEKDVSTSVQNNRVTSTTANSELDLWISPEVVKDFRAYAPVIQTVRGGKSVMKPIETSGIHCSAFTEKEIHKSLQEICDQTETKTTDEKITEMPHLYSVTGEANVMFSSDLSNYQVTKCCKYIMPEWTCNCYNLCDDISAKLTKDVCDTSNEQTESPPVYNRQLEYLNLSGCLHVTDNGLRALSDNGGLPHLQHLDLSGCFRITADGLTELVICSIVTIYMMTPSQIVPVAVKIWNVPHDIAVELEIKKMNVLLKTCSFMNS
ncbi:hypothetical protein KUTeg_020429 [Tegillarca granosa]|uniref:F-box/LRR-repeat protein 5 n=1 Tax=Tegillarca granosa TaxID=220873 RepID=A0ABQ9EC25_TEGGR|nr:hypothetical protein KUTeg_020429 [Tegillarca granosa]